MSSFSVFSRGFEGTRPYAGVSQWRIPKRRKWLRPELPRIRRARWRRSKSLPRIKVSFESQSHSGFHFWAWSCIWHLFLISGTSRRGKLSWRRPSQRRPESRRRPPRLPRTLTSQRGHRLPSSFSCTYIEQDDCSCCFSFFFTFLHFAILNAIDQYVCPICVSFAWLHKFNECLLCFREQFRKTFKEDHPEAKGVAVVRIIFVL